MTDYNVAFKDESSEGVMRVERVEVRFRNGTTETVQPGQVSAQVGRVDADEIIFYPGQKTRRLSEIKSIDIVPE